MSESTLRAAIKTVLDGVTDIGKVYDYQRRVDTWPEYLNLFKTSVAGVPQIRAWMISLTEMPAEGETIRGEISARSYSYQIQGLMSLDDSEATEKTFVALTETVCNALDDALAIHSKTVRGDVASVSDYSYVVLGDVLCHSAVIQQSITEWRTATRA